MSQIWGLRTAVLPSPFRFSRLVLGGCPRNRSANRRRPYLLAVAGILGLLLCADVARADVYGRIRGTVKDPSGAAVVGAKVTATNTATGISKEISTADDGSYDFLQLAAPAPYTVTVERTGFRKYEADRIPLNVNQVYVLDVALELGAVTETITVEATQTQVETTSIELGAIVNDTTIVNMPLNGRYWTDLMQLEPGVVAASDARGGQGHGNFATNGSQPDQNSYLINGTDNNDLPLNEVQVNPSPDAIAEFKMVTGTFNPEYGRNSGAILNAIIKSGTNSFHGDAFDFYRDTALNARNFFQPTPAVFHRHTFGGTVGGPIKKDKAFIFFSYQGNRQRRPELTGDCGCSNPGTTPVFTSAQRGGFFPDVATSAGVSAVSLTGEDGLVHPAGTAYSVLFPTGHIPTSDFNSISAGLLKYVPMPTVGNLFEFNPVFHQGDDQELGRFDANITSKDAFWFYGLGEREHDQQDIPFFGATVPGFPQVDHEHWQQYIADWTHTFSGTMLNEARIGYTRFNYLDVVPANPADPSSAGFTGISPQQLGVGLPVLTIPGYFNLGFTSNGPQPRLDQTYDFTDNFSKVVGKHALKFGFDMRRFEVYNPFLHLIDGDFTFSAPATDPLSTGDPGADFLLGLPSSYLQASGDILNERAQEYYSYAQDQWKMRTNLTITYGLGWSIDTPMVDNYHGNHAGVAFRPGQQSVVFPTAPTGYVFQGDPGVNAFGTTHFKDIAPRFGFAYSPDWGRLTGGPGKTSIRGGFGIYYNRFNGETALQTQGSPPFAITSTGIGDAGLGAFPTLADPFTGYVPGGVPVSIPNKFPYAPSATPNFLVTEPMSLSVYDPNISIPYAENYSLTIQRQFGGSSVVSLGYVGSVGRRLLIAHEINPGNGAACAANPACVAAAPNQETAFPGNYPYPGNIFASIGEVSTIGSSNYNAFQATLDKRLSHGLQFMAAYTYSHALDDGSGFENSGFNGGGFGGFGNTRSIDPFNQRLRDYGPSIYDARHRFVISYVYMIPSMRHFSALKALPSKLTDGWQLSGITTFQSGFPLDVVDSTLPSLQANGSTFYCTPGFACWDLPNVVGPIKYENPKTNPTNLWFDPSAFAHPTPGTQGNAGRDILRGPGLKNWDFAFMKETTFTESTRLELRIEFFNIFNTTQFDPSGITTDIGAGAAFGQETKARDPRIIQLAGKFYF